MDTVGFLNFKLCYFFLPNIYHLYINVHLTMKTFHFFGKFMSSFVQQQKPDVKHNGNDWFWVFWIFCLLANAQGYSSCSGFLSVVKG